MKDTKSEKLVLCLLWVFCSLLAAAVVYFTVILIQNNHYVLAGVAGFAALYFITSSLEATTEFIRDVFSLLDKD
jgi:hypothetical protein